MADHAYESHENCLKEGQCPICDGGLVACTICGGAEASLPTQCPQKEMTEKQKDEVQSGDLEFFGGKWWRLENT